MLLLQTSWFAYFSACLVPRLLGVSVEQGAASPLYCATAPAAALARGGMYDEGPNIRLFDLTKAKHYSSENAVAAFEAIEAAIIMKGGPRLVM